MRLPVLGTIAALLLSQGASAQTRPADAPSAVVCEFSRRASGFSYSTTIRLNVDWTRQARTALVGTRDQPDFSRKIIGGDLWEGTIQTSNSNRATETATASYPAMVTSQPSSQNALLVYWLQGDYPMVVRANWSSRRTVKEATYYDSQVGELVRGDCR